MSNNSNNNASQVIDKPISAIEALCQFNGERLVKMEGVSASEAVRLAVHKIESGDTMRAQGVFVIAQAAKSQANDEQRQAFTDALRAEFINTQVDKALALLPPNAKEGQKTLAKDNATKEAKKRFDNLAQAVRAAKWMLENPKKVADGVSVFTVAQANAYLEAPKAAEGKEVDADKLALHKAVTPLLAKPGVTQAAIKEAIAAKREEIAKAKEVPDDRSEEKKAADAMESRKRQLVTRAVMFLEEWDKLVNEGQSVDDLRALLVSPAIKDSAKLSEKMKAIGVLSGLK